MLLGVLAGWGRFAISFVTGFIQVRLLLRYLSDGEAGTWFVITNALGYMMLLDFGLGATLARQVAFARGDRLPAGWRAGEGRGAADPRELAVADLLATVGKVFLIGAGVLVFAGAWVGFAMLPRVTGDATGPFVVTWGLASLGGGFALLGVVPSAALFGANALHLQQTVAGGIRLVGLLLTVVLLDFGLGMPGVALSFALQNLSALLINRRLVRGLFPFLRHAPGRPQWPIARQLFAPSLQLALVTMGGAFILQTDNLLVSWRLGVAAVPTYSVAFQLAYLLLSLTLVISGPAVALSARAHAENSADQLKYLLGLNLRLGLAFLVVGAGLLGALGRDLLVLWVGVGRFVGAPTLLLMLVVMALEAHTAIHMRVITATARIAAFVPSFALAALLNVVASYFLAGWWGWPGVIAGTLFAQALTNYWYVPLYTHRHLSVSWAEYRAWLAPVLMLLVVMVSLASAVSGALSPLSPLARLSAGGPLLGAGGAAWSYFRVLEPDERARLRAWLLGRLRGGR